MNLFRLLPVLLSFLLLAAHYYRAGLPVLSVACVLFPLLLLVKKPLVPMVVQTALILAAVEWLRTLMVVAQIRVETGQPWVRMAIILGVVMLFTGLSALVFRAKTLRNRYQ